MKKFYKIFSIVVFSLLFADIDSDKNQPLIKQFTKSGGIESLINITDEGPYILIELYLKNDSLLSIINDLFPHVSLSSPATFHRIVTDEQLSLIEQNLDTSNFSILNQNYTLPFNTRLYWVDVEPGSNTYGTYSDDDAIEYTCSCLSGASDCVKLGWDDGWYNPFDYWGEAWYDFNPPYYQSIQEIRITVTGGQCDALPVWSETYMGMRDDAGNWPQDYQLSIDYTENVFIINPPVWSEGMLMPQIGSEDNYVIDKMRIDFYYTCNSPEQPQSDFIASDEESCSFVDINWNLSTSDYSQQYLYRDNVLIGTLDINETSFQDWLASPNQIHTYCINLVNECGESDMVCDQGSLKSIPPPLGSVTASDGLYLDRIITSWNPDETAHTYKIYRDGTWLGIYTNGETEYTDLYIVLNEEYQYCIEAINECGMSDWACDTGFSSTQPGDLNQDAIFNIIDVVLMVNIIIGLEDENEYTEWAADLNQDDSINIQDIIMLINLIISN